MTKKPKETLWKTLRKQILVALRNTDGFSLIEMAIVLLIVGIVAGGILKGQEMIEQAKLQATIQQVEQLKLAVTNFQGQFNALPGAFSQAKERLNDSLVNGAGRGYVQGSGLEGEALHFWAHLERSGFANILTPARGQPALGNGLLEAKVGGGFTVAYNVFQEGKHWFVLGNISGNRGDLALLTPKQAYYFDQKLSNGSNKGVVRAKDGSNSAGKCLKNGTYDLSQKEPACVVYFQFS